MVEFKTDTPMKILVEDVKNFEKIQNSWVYKFGEGNTTKNINKVILQGQIVKTAGFSNEILIIDDGTGKAKITRGSQIPGNLSWVEAGLHCSVVGTVLGNGKLPLIVADKIAKINNRILLEMWPLEVQELKNVLVNKTIPKLLEHSIVTIS